MQFFGDAYDFAKIAIIDAIKSSNWHSLPMFTDADIQNRKNEYEKLTKTIIANDAIITPETHDAYFAAPQIPLQGNIFIDPDTGIDLNHPRKRKSTHVYMRDIEHLLRLPSVNLLMIYDQSISRSVAHGTIEDKLEAFKVNGLSASYYCCNKISFAFLASNRSELHFVEKMLRDGLHIPNNRFKKNYS